jgi:hypothetical protein
MLAERGIQLGDLPQRRFDPLRDHEASPLRFQPWVLEGNRRGIGTSQLSRVDSHAGAIEKGGDVAEPLGIADVRDVAVERDRPELALLAEQVLRHLEDEALRIGARRIRA